ncbi:MAG: hypothetical protein K5905_24950 [Roseibium sp.]|uniref:hypothetical protein n=1 Tax=Roseibium sp. TaxID=1936156 RepID=UPI002639BB7F|nr:hypothetical protein [Roseibium sp.]MCV0428717.1 hypothetical protein [Roseibium sp.]
MSLNEIALYFFYRYMFLTFQVFGAVALSDYSIYRLFSIAIAAICDFLLHRALVDLQDLQKISGFLDEFPECYLKKIPINQILPDTILKSIGNVDGKDLSSWLHLFYVVRGKPIDAPTRAPSTDLAFLGSQSAMIFTNSPAIKMSPQQKFRLYHEIGHTSRSAQLLAYRELVAGLPFIYLLAWWIFQMDHATTPSWALWALTIALVLVQYLQSTAGRVYYDALNEAVADHFALTHLSHEERVHVAKYILGNFPRRFPFDISLLTLNEDRALDLRNKLQLILDEGSNVVSFKEIQARPLWFWWLGPLLAGILVFLTVPASPAVLLGLSEITLVLGLVQFVLVVRRRRKESKVSSSLSQRTAGDPLSMEEDNRGQ